MNIGVDLDGVLADTMGPTTHILNGRFNLAVRYEEIVNWNYWQSEQQITKGKLLAAMDHAWQTEQVVPEATAKTTLHDLRRLGHNIIIITRRTTPSQERVSPWLNKHKLEHDALVFLNTNGVSKLSLPIHALVDDHQREFDQLALGRYFYLYNQPWNQDSLLPRVRTLAEFAERVKEDFRG